MLKWALIAALARSASATCYYPDGSNAAKDYNYLPCSDANTTYSTCCYFGEGDTCLQNGLCNMPGKFDYRAACQNKDWSNCPEICMDTETGTWLPLKKCSENEYCCPSSAGSDCCDNGSQTTKLKAPDTDSGSGSENEASDSASEAASGDEAASTGNPTSSGFVSVIRTTIVSSSDPTAGSSGDPEKAPTSAGAIAGGVVGGIAVIGILVLAGFCFLKRRGNKPSGSPEGATVVIAGAGGSNGPNSSDDEKEKPVVDQKPQPGIPEIEGSAGNKYWEADSQAISRARFAVRNEAEQADGNAKRAAEETQKVACGKPAKYQSQQQRTQWPNLPEIEGSAGNVYTEADSQAISAAQFAQRAEEEARRRTEEGKRREEPAKQQREPPAKQLQQQAKIEGNIGNGYTDADPRIIGVQPFFPGSNQGAGFSHTTMQEKPPHPQTQRPGLAEIQGSSGNIYAEAGSQAFGAAGVTQGQQAQMAAQRATVAKQQAQRFEIEGSAGNVYTEADSRVIGAVRPAVQNQSGGQTQNPAQEKPTKLQGQQQAFTEVEGTPGNLYVEADTLAASPFRPAKTKPDSKVPTEDKPMKDQGQQKTLTETEGSIGNVDLEADSHVAVDPSRPTEVKPQPQGVAEDKPTNHHGQQQVSAQAAGSPGNEFMAAGPYVINTALVGETKQNEKPANPHGVPTQQQNLVEPWASMSTASSVSQLVNHTQPLESKPVGLGKPSKVQGILAQQQMLAEAEGSVGNVYHEVESRPSQTGRPSETKLDEEKPTKSQVQEKGPAEVAGNPGNIYTEVDSKPVKKAVQVQQQTLVEAEGSVGDAYTEAGALPVNPIAPTNTRREEEHSKAQSLQSLAEVEGSVGNIYTEADSEPVAANPITTKPVGEKPANLQGQGQGLVEAEGSPGILYSEADSQPANTPRPPATWPARVDKPAEIRGRGLAEVEGSAGSVYFEANSQATLTTDFTQSVEQHSILKEKQTQFNLVEVEGSGGTVYMEADSQPIRQARLVETKRVTGDVRELEGKSPAH